MILRFAKTFFIVTVFISSTAEAKSSWELNKQADGIKVYVRDIPNSKLKSFRGEITIPTRLTSLVAALEDTKVFPRLFHQCKSAKSLKKTGSNEHYNYIVTGMPWPVNPRDSITHSVLRQDKKTKKIDIAVNSKPKMLPEKKGIVRVKHLAGRWEFVPLNNGGVKVVYELSIIPGGKIPTWLVNLLIVDTPFFTLKNLRNLVKEPAYKNAKLGYIID